jgi:hypothetical protein
MCNALLVVICHSSSLCRHRQNLAPRNPTFLSQSVNQKCAFTDCASAVSLPSPTIFKNALPNLEQILKFSTNAHLLISPLPAFQVRAAAPQERRSSHAQLFAGLGAAALILTSGVNPEAANAAWVARPSLEGKVAAPREAVRVARDSLGNLLSDTKSAAENLQVYCIGSSLVRILRQNRVWFALFVCFRLGSFWLVLEVEAGVFQS